MRKPALLYNAWKEESKLFTKNLLILKRRITVDAVHDLRVCIKKLRAYRNLFYRLNENESKIKFTETKELFAVLGKLNNIHICLQLLAGYEKEKGHNYDKFKEFLDYKSKQAGPWVKEHAKKYSGKELDMLDMILKNDESQKKEEFTERLCHEVNSIIHELPNLFHEPHQVRIKLKRAYHWMRTLPEEKTEQCYNVKEINDALEELGIWQDNEVLIKEIRYFRKDSLPKAFEENKQLKELAKYIKDKKQSAKELLEQIKFLK